MADGGVDIDLYDNLVDDFSQVQLCYTYIYRFIARFDIIYMLCDWFIFILLMNFAISKCFSSVKLGAIVFCKFPSVIIMERRKYGRYCRRFNQYLTMMILLMLHAVLYVYS